MQLNPIDEAELTLAPFRGNLPPRSRIGYVVYANLQKFMTQDESVQFYFAAQYTLAPSLLRLIHVPDCLASSPATCGLTNTNFILMRDVKNDRFHKLVKDLDFIPIAESKGFVLLRRKPQ